MDPLLGSIQLFAFNFAPTGWLPCTGQLLPLAQNQALYSLVGTTYGGDGVTEFALPDLREKAPAVGSQFCICTNGVYPSRP